MLRHVFNIYNIVPKFLKLSKVHAPRTASRACLGQSGCTYACQRTSTLLPQNAANTQGPHMSCQQGCNNKHNAPKVLQVRSEQAVLHNTLLHPDVICDAMWPA
eukprot:1189223-Amphidinium_carterae.1